VQNLLGGKFGRYQRVADRSGATIDTCQATTGDVILMNRNTSMVNHWDRSLLKISTGALILTAVILPAGSFAGIPFKHVAYFFCCATLFICWFRGVKINSTYLALFIGSLLFVTFYMLVGSFYATSPFYYTFAEGTSFISTISVVLLILMANSSNSIEDKEIVLFVFYGILIFSLWKFVVLLLLYFNIVPFHNLMLFFENYLRFKPVTLEMPGEFQRITFSAQDLGAVIFLFLLPAYPGIFSKVSRFFRIIFMFTGTAAVVSNYSRFFFIFLAILWFYLFLFKFSFKQRLFACAIVVVILLLSFSWIMEAYELRFKSNMAAGSDITRFYQISALIAGWEESPILGGGIGYYAKNYIRSMYFYEVQWIAFLAKLGIVGIIYLLFLASLLFYKILSGKRSLDHYALAFILLFTLLSGFTNPLLLGAATSILYVLPLMVASILRKKLISQATSTSTSRAV